MKMIPKKYLYLVALSIIWGTSFILIKKALVGLEPLQLGAARTIISGAILIALGWNTFKDIPKKSYIWIALSGFLGSFFPAFLFAYAQTEIDSSISAILNATVPLLTLILGASLFGIMFTRNQLIGVLVGLAGAIALVLTSSDANPDQNYYYVILVFIACICYASNVNIIKRYLQNVKPLAIAAGNFVFILPPALMVYFYAGGFELDYSSPVIRQSFYYILILSVMGTVSAKILFNKLVQLTSPVFASSVTYLIPIVGLTWGVLDGESFGLLQAVSMLIIIGAVIIVSRNKKPPLQE